MLNQVFNPENAISVVYDKNDDTPIYEIEPLIKNSLFTEYFVTLTPETNRITSIYARSKKKQGCRNEKNILVSSLENKYGEAKVPKADEIKGHTSATQTYFNQDKRFIVVECQVIEVDSYLVIYYADQDLLKLAKNQRPNQPQEFVKPEPILDMSGL